MNTEIKVGTKVQHNKQGFEGVVTRLSTSSNYAHVQITKGIHPYNPNAKTYQADVDNLTVLEELKVGSLVVHKEHGFTGVLETYGFGNARVQITSGVHPFEPLKKTYDASPRQLELLDEKTGQHFEKLLQEFKKKVEKAERQAVVQAESIVKLKVEAQAKADEDYEMEIEMNGMIIRTDFKTFNKIVKHFGTN